MQDGSSNVGVAKHGASVHPPVRRIDNISGMLFVSDLCAVASNSGI